MGTPSGLRIVTAVGINSQVTLDGELLREKGRQSDDPTSINSRLFSASSSLEGETSLVNLLAKVRPIGTENLDPKSNVLQNFYRAQGVETRRLALENSN